MSNDMGYNPPTIDDSSTQGQVKPVLIKQKSKTRTSSTQRKPHFGKPKDDSAGSIKAEELDDINYELNYDDYDPDFTPMKAMEPTRAQLGVHQALPHIRSRKTQ